MRERAAELGGTCTVEPRPDGAGQRERANGRGGVRTSIGLRQPRRRVSRARRSPLRAPPARRNVHFFRVEDSTPLLEPANRFARRGIVARIARIRMRGQPASSRDRHPRRSGPSRGGAAGSGGDALRVVRATRDQLGVAWSAEADPLSWQVVCWDSRDAAVARLKLSGTHRRATFAGLARLQQPFTIAVSGLGGDGSVLWQGGLADLYLRAGRPAGREGASDRMRTRRHRSTDSQGRREAVSPKRPKKDAAPGKMGKTREPKPKKKTARGK